MIVFVIFILSLTQLSAQIVPFSFWKSANSTRPSAAAYSLRKVVPSYSGPLIRVRRSSDNAEQDIGYDGSGDLDTSALTTFVGAGNGFVRTWYDQSGNALNATQATTTAQPRVVLAGVVETTNTKPTVRFLGSEWMSVSRPVVDDWTLIATFTATHTTATVNAYDAAAIFGGEVAGNVNDATIGGVHSGLWMAWAGNNSGVPTAVMSSYIHVNNGVARVGSQRRVKTTGSIETWLNGVTTGSGTSAVTSHSAVTTMAMGASAGNGSGNKWVGTFSEVIIYAVQLPDAERESLEQDQATYYGITWGGSWPTTPSTVLSVRRVVAGYSGPLLRVRRSNDNAESDIGFDGSGNLDTTALSTFVSTNSAFVRTWYDQSGNGYHATQTTIASQPRLVSAGVIDTISGRPTVRFLGSQWMSVRRVAVYNWTLVASFSATHDLGSGNWYSAPAIFSGDVSGTTNDFAMGGVGGGRWVVGVRDDNVGLKGSSPNINSGFIRVGSQRRTWSSGLAELWVSGASEGSGTLSTSAHTAVSTMAIGAQAPDGSNNKWTGTMSEIIVYDRAINNTERDTEEQSQATYFGAPMASSGNICDSGDYSTVCVITSPKIYSGATLSGTGNLSVRNGGSITAVGTSSLTIDFATTEIQSGGLIQGNVTFNGANLDIQSGGTVQANGLGHAGSTGAGSGTGGGGVGVYGQGAGGGGHGGAGGNGGTVSGGTTYGSLTNPVTWGSSGGGYSTSGGNGGGAIRVNITGNINIAGTLSVNGGNSASSPGCCQVTGGGGAGGSIWITSATITGSGTISSKGGYGGTLGSTTGAYLGSGGGGGRIAIESNTAFAGTVNVAGGDYIDDTFSIQRGYLGTYSSTLNTNLCDSGDLSTTCTVSTVKNLGSGYAITGTGNLIVATGGSLRAVGGNQQLSFSLAGDLTVQNGALVDANITSLVAANVDIQTGGIIRANAKGYIGLKYAAGTGTGPGAVGVYNSGAGGGGHGGAGATQGTSTGGTTYGSATNPVTWGSAGGGFTTAGGTGGGAIRINISGNLNVAGTLSANGGNSDPLTWGTCCRGTGGGGAGGSIWITTGTVSGTGTISVAGGAGGTLGTTSYSFQGGSGGGGRIALESGTYFPGTINISGGVATTNGDDGTYTAIISGTICDSGDLSTTCTISSSKTLGSGFSLSGAGNLVMASGGRLQGLPATAEISINMTGNVTVQNGGIIDANITSLVAANVDIQTGGIVRANSRGFQGKINAAGTGTGGGQLSVYNNGTGGGGHGGAGGTGGSSVGGSAYGSSTNPVTWGSAGGGGFSAGGHGGGAIRINIAGTLTVNGTLSANAGNSANITDGFVNSGGGGAGGSIWITTGVITGTGTISATGGSAGTVSGSYSIQGSGGGGGRIAIESDKYFGGTVNVNRGLGNTYGSQGTFVTSVTGNSCDSGDLSTTCTISSTKNMGTSSSLSGSGNLVIASGGNLISVPATAEISVNVSGDVTVQSGGVIDANITSLVAANVDIQTGGIVRANNRGYQGGTFILGAGTGGGQASVYNNGTGGGGHGGAGGSGGSSLGGSTYGSSTNPVTWGSAGGGGFSAGGHGGGAIRINISGTLTVAGLLTANGGASDNITAGFTNSGGGGAGGSIWITSSAIAGSGTIAATGGSGGTVSGAYSVRGSGGGGGRLSGYSAFAGTLSAAGGAGGSAGATGSLNP